jgi:hypothetical protein
MNCAFMIWIHMKSVSSLTMRWLKWIKTSLRCLIRALRMRKKNYQLRKKWSRVLRVTNVGRKERAFLNKKWRLLTSKLSQRLKVAWRTFTANLMLRFRTSKQFKRKSLLSSQWTISTTMMVSGLNTYNTSTCVWSKMTWLLTESS